MPPPETASLTQFPYIALNLAALRMKSCRCHLLRASGSGFRSRGERSLQEWYCSCRAKLGFSHA